MTNRNPEEPRLTRTRSNHKKQEESLRDVIEDLKANDKSANPSPEDFMKLNKFPSINGLGSVQSIVGNDLQRMYDEKNKHSLQAQLAHPNLGASYSRPGLTTRSSVHDMLSGMTRQNSARQQQNFEQYPMKRTHQQMAHGSGQNTNIYTNLN